MRMYCNRPPSAFPSVKLNWVRHDQGNEVLKCDVHEPVMILISIV